MTKYDDFMEGLEAAIASGMEVIDGEEYFVVETASERVVDYLEELGLLVFYNDN